MDYEVFLLSRIQEAFWQTGDNTKAVALGMQRSGGIITNAAIIVIVVSSCFATADMILVKALGLGMALAVLIDATLVRGLLVPATMRLLGNANWWLPFAGVQRHPRTLEEYMQPAAPVPSDTPDTTTASLTDANMGGKR
ncbi:MAG: MMPL family transporter [Ktedonobacteraceae bacterium]